MRKAVLILMIVVFLFALSAPALASAEGSTPYEYASAFATLFPERSVLTGKEKESSDYLASFLETLGYRVDMPSYSYRYTSLETNATVTREYRHVLGFKDNGRGKSIVIGAYYGGYDPESSSSVGQGAEVALSVGALQYIAEVLRSYTEFDIVIAFWGGMAVDDFDVTKCGVDLSTVALYIGLDGVAAGTNDYWYCDDVPRAHERYFKEIIEEADAEILAPPVYKHTTLLSLSDGAYTGVHLGLLGVNRYFLNQDVPSIAFVGGAWSYDAGLYRYEGKAEISGTSDDTFEVIDKRNGGREETEKRLLSVSNVIVAALMGDCLYEILDEAAEGDVSGADLDSALAYYLITFIGAGVIILLFVLLIVKQGKDRREEIWENGTRGSEGQTAEVPPSDTNPFREFDPYDDSVKKDADDGDDVFRF